MKVFDVLLFTTVLLFSFACGRSQEKAEDKGQEPQGKVAKPLTYSVEMREGTSFVHNTGRVWGDEPKIRLEPLAIIGGPGNTDAGLTFHKPTDLAVDAQGYLYVADSGNNRIQKLDPEGNFLGSIGRKGQGPGEFQYLDGLLVDKTGKLYFTDRATKAVKILSPEGKEIGTGPAGRMIGKMAQLSSGDLVLGITSRNSDALVSVFNPSGELRMGLGQLERHDDEDRFRYFNRVAFANDRADNIYIAYSARNKIEKYDPSGTLTMSIDRPLNFPISQEITYEEHEFGPRKIPIPFVNFVSGDIAVDDKERLWVLSYERQLKFEEMGLTMHFADGEGRYEGAKTLQTSETTKIDAFAFHIFSSEGHFLGKLPLTHHGGEVKIFQDRLYILEPRHEMCVYAYRIIE
jgi:hypothetical protein